MLPLFRGSGSFRKLMSINTGEIIEQIYQPPRANDGWCFEDILDEQMTTYFCLARQALFVALKSAGVREGDHVLLPELICADILPAITSLRAIPVYYPVDNALQPVLDQHQATDVKAIIAVNYFGFPQSIDACRDYCQLHGALLIEDNAHGLFSRDQYGVLLGCRGDVGIFSLRKTLPLMNGAALVVNQNKCGLFAVSHETGAAMPVSSGWKVKSCMRRLVPFIGTRGFQTLLGTGRFFRDRLVPAVTSTESKLFIDGVSSFDVEPPYTDFARDVAATDTEEEMKRRRELYMWLETYLQNYPCAPVFRSLGAHVVPYGYPFYAEERDMPAICKRLKQQGLACFSWPNLPKEIEADVPAWYKKIRVVQFLW